MDFEYTREQDEFRKELRAFLAREIPSDWVEQIDEADDAIWEFTKQFTRKVGSRGWLRLTWPPEYGGEASQDKRLVFVEEMCYHKAPYIVSNMGVNWVAPSVMEFGSPEQKAKYLPGIGEGSIFFCTGYSEPNAGSDLASLSTRAVEQTDHFLINGQKIWTGKAHRADFCWLAARTDTTAPKHKGISLFIVDMKTPGVMVRPIINLLGQHMLNEVYFDDVHVPKSNLVGEKNRGWDYLARALNHERTLIGTFSSVKRSLDDLVKHLRNSPTPQTGAQRHLARHAVAEMIVEVEVGLALAYRVFSMQRGRQTINQEISQLKLFATELEQRVARVGIMLLGPYGQLRRGSKWALLDGSYAELYMRTIASTIGGGTSEVMRNVIATRGLGLPR